MESYLTHFRDSLGLKIDREDIRIMANAITDRERLRRRTMSCYTSLGGPCLPEEGMTSSVSSRSWTISLIPPPRATTIRLSGLGGQGTTSTGTPDDENYDAIMAFLEGSGR